MPPNGWATPLEHEYLVSLIPEYKACQEKRRYKGFWQRVNAEFLSRFPVMEKLFPGRKIVELKPEEKEMYTIAVARQKQRLKEWFRWKLNPRGRNAGSVVTKQDPSTIYTHRTRPHKPYEVFAKMYPDDVEKEKVARCKAAGITGRRTLNVWQNVSRELYETASSERREAVKKAMEDKAKEKGELLVGSSSTPTEYLRYLKKPPTLLDAAASPIVRRAGALAFATIVAPDSQNGNIVCKSLQSGDKGDTPIFAQLWDGHGGLFVEGPTHFYRQHEFTPEICAARSMIPLPLPQNSTLKGSSRSPTTLPSQAGPASTGGLSKSPIGTQPSQADVPDPQAAITASATSSSAAQAPLLPNPLNSLPSPGSNHASMSPAIGRINSQFLPQSPSATPCPGPVSPVRTTELLFMSPSRMGSSSPNGEVRSNYTSGPYLADGPAADVMGSTGVNCDHISAGWNFPDEHWGVMRNTLQGLQEDVDMGLATGGPLLHMAPDGGNERQLLATAAQGATLSQASCDSLSGVLFPNASATPSPSISFHPSSSFFSSPRLPPRSPLSTPVALEFDRTLLDNVSLGLSCSSPALPSQSVFTLPSSPQPPQSPSNPESLSSLLCHPGGSSLYGPVSMSGNVRSPSFPSPLFSSSSPRTLLHSGPLPCLTAFTHGQSLALDKPDGLTLNRTSATRGSLASRNSATHAGTPPVVLSQSPAFEGRVETHDGNASSAPFAPIPQPVPRQSNQVTRATSMGLTPSPPPQPIPEPASACQAVRVPVVSFPLSLLSAAASAGGSSSVPLVYGSDVPDQEPSERNTSGEAGWRRSPRGAYVPFKRNEQLQKIGTSDADQGEANWFSLAVENLRRFELGDDWKKLVEVWANFEISMGCGRVCKGTLSTAGRPGEWQKWTAKAWQGTRRYDTHPPIDSAADLATAFSRWWLSLQPSFRRSDGDRFPLPVVTAPDSDSLSDVWATLRKSGQSGFVSVVMLLAWWGHAAGTTTSQWEDDSRPTWRRIVSDVTSVVVAMASTPPEQTAKGAKRLLGKENTALTGASKKR